MDIASNYASPALESIADGRVVASTRTMSRTFVVYGLREEGTTAVRYVGQSNNPIGRSASHINAGMRGPDVRKSQVNLWADEMHRHSRHVEMFVIDSAATQREIDTKEMLWICRFRHQGQADLNTTVDRTVLRATALESAA